MGKKQRASDMKAIKHLRWTQTILARYFAQKCGVPNSGFKVKRIISLICGETGWKKPIGKVAAFDFMHKFYREIVEPGAPVSQSAPKRKITLAEFNAFYHTPAWRNLRYAVLKKFGAICQCCGATPVSSGRPMHVDHIKPRSKHPELELVFDNLQILCEDCNMGKGGRDQTDWRDIPDPDEIDDLTERFKATIGPLN